MSIESSLFLYSLKDFPIHADIWTWSVASEDLRQNFVLIVIMSWTLCMNQRWLALVNLQLFADKIHAGVSPLYNCWGFIDGTDRPICRPRNDQRILYSDHKKVNAIKFQSVVTPIGLITNWYGPVEGQRHDSGRLVIRLISQSSTVCHWPNNNIRSLYGDLMYPIRPQLTGPFQCAARTALQNSWNKAMNQLRVSVEWITSNSWSSKRDSNCN